MGTASAPLLCNMAPRFAHLVWTGLALAALGNAQAAQSAEKGRLEYDRDVRPILSENCFPCHGQDAKKRMAGLRLDLFSGATVDRGGHVALSPGKPEASAMYQRITAEQKSKRMPPASSNRTLSSQQIAILKRWIEQGGEYTKHWAFVPPVRPAVPVTADPSWVKQPVDAFIHKRLESEGLQPSPAARPATWLRRVSLDLTGLPPSAQQLDVFSNDAKTRGEAAYASTADRLLATPAYGERMAMDWLDVARYADTHGFNNDAARSMWRWRDWVIQSFNDNKPYDRFLTEQLAGDLIPNATLEQRIATGFQRNHIINSEGGIIEEEYRLEYVTDRVRTLGMAWLGLTLECAHCHDHKFDPITQRDHYRFFAFFNNVPEIGEDGRVSNAVPIVAAPTTDQQRKLRLLEAAIDKLSKKIDLRAKSGRKRDYRSIPASVPDGAALELHCESAENGLTLVEGVLGHSCALSNARTKPQTAGKGVPLTKRDSLTFSAWLNPSVNDKDVALLSSLDYSKNIASVTFGSGIELRLIGGEVEFRFSEHYPAYSIRVRSEGAGMEPGQWQNVAVVYEGAAGKTDMQVRASWVRMFANGRELPTRILNDDLPLPDAAGDKPVFTTFRIGWDNAANSASYAGFLDEVTVWNRALTTPEIDALFESRALPYATARQRAHKASRAEEAWLREAALRASDIAFAKDLDELQKLRTYYLALRRDAPTVMVMEEMVTPRETKVLIRGSYDAPGEKVEAGVPEVLLGPWPVGAPRNRLGLAQWLTKPDHPLTSRVVVNRFWQQLFGQGLVKTSDNFGLQGEWPSHPELLDWMACEFIESGWNVKTLMKRLVLSATYRQDSAGSPELTARDPENRLLARGPRFRLPAEVIRDQALQISGLLKPRLGGPSVYPYQVPDLYKGIVVAANYPGTKYVESQGDDLYRRSLYTFWKRTVPHPTLNVFDAPDREICIVRRSKTNTPLQALTLLNDPIYVEAARKLAERSIQEGGSTPEARLTVAFRLATGRSPDEPELRILRTILDKMLANFRADEPGARSLLSVGASNIDRSIPVDELAAYTAVANVILNMDETITKG